MSKTEVKTFLIDGLWGWSPRMQRLARSLEGGGIKYPRIYSYNSLGTEPFERLAEQFIKIVKKGGPFQVVAHSMGGIVLRTAMLMEPTLDLQKAVFICVPHVGSLMAYLIPLPGVKQLQPNSALMRQLREQPWATPNLSIWCPGDLMVFPGRNARWERATEILCCNVPIHNWPVFSKRYHQKIIHFLMSAKYSHAVLPGCLSNINKSGLDNCNSSNKVRE